jgi:tRNA(Ile)-lysidine synthase
MSSTEDQWTVEQSVLQYLGRYGISPGSAVLIALSGGPDSLCLLCVLHGLRERHPLRLSAAYLDHGIRTVPERERELEFVQRTCSAMGIDLTWERMPQGLLEKRSAGTGRSLEEVARQVRYAFLRETAARKACDYVALGHTADDQIETVVMRFFQGVGLGGLPGIPPARKDLLRPLIDCTRAEILDYLSGHGLAYITDSTNRDKRYLRNAVRSELLPVVERIFPGFRGSVLSLSKKLADLRNYVDSESRRRLRWKRAGEGYSIPGRHFLAAPGLLRLVSVTRLLNTLAADSTRVPYRFLSQVQEDDILLSRRVVLSGYGIRLYWRAEQLILAADVVGHTEKGYFIEESEAGRVFVPEAGLFFEFGSLVRGADRFLFRSARTGDRINLQGASKTVKQIFAQWQVARSESWKIPIVESTAGIIAVLGALFGYEDRFHSGLPHEQGKALKRMVHRYDVEVE